MTAIRIRLADVLGFAAPLVLLAVGAAVATPTRTWVVSLSVWTGCIALGVVSIGLRARFPGRFTEILAAFWPIPVVFAIYATLNPVIDRVSPALMDPFLMRADHALLGGYLAVWADGHIPPFLVDLLMVCYASYYLWPVLLAALLFRENRHEALARLTTLVLMAVWLNMLFYVLVPVIGPRFSLATHFTGPPQGWLVGTALYEAFLRSPMIRDCFPSGHTALSLLILWFAFRHHRRLFWVMLPVVVGLLSATFLLRFHYLLDLVFAVPFLLGVHALWVFVSARVPDAWEWAPAEGVHPAHI